MISAVLQYLNKKQDWQQVKFAEFILIIMVLNGAKMRLNGQYNFSDFFVLLQDYYAKMKGT